MRRSAQVSSDLHDQLNKDQFAVLNAEELTFEDTSS